MHTKTKISTFEFENCIMNAAGVYCFDESELSLVYNSCSATFVTKTATLQPRLGNPTPRYMNTALGSINSMGLPNLGFDYYLAYLLKLQKQNPNKPLFFSVTGMHQDEIHQLLRKIQESEFNGLTELNLSCPNVVGKPQIAYDLPTTKQLLTEVFSYFKKPLGIKIPPYFDIVHFDQAADVFNQFPLTFVNAINSIGNGLVIEDETVVIKPKNGFGGIGGAYIKPTALANVHAFYQRLNPNIQMIGTGGVENGRDVFELILCGASMVQIGTILQKEGISAFERITNELKVIMDEKGYTCIDDFKGKLQYQ